MRARLKYLTALAALTTVTGLAFAPAASAATPVTITPGAFCAEADKGKIRPADDGDLYVCRKDGEVHRWKPVTAGEAPKPADPKPPKDPEPTTRPVDRPDRDSGSAGGAGRDGGSDGAEQLPVTGVDAGVLAGIASMLLAAGGIVLIVVRRRRVRFVAR